MSVAAVILLFLLGLLSPASAVSFNFPRFPPNNTPNITYEGDATASLGGVIDLTNSQPGTSPEKSRGWARFSHPVRLWDAATRNLTSFTTTFSFYVGALEGRLPGDGLAFFLAPSGSSMPNGTRGSTLALFGDGQKNNALPPPAQIVAVEFDTYRSFWDPDGVHVGINVWSIVSVVNASWAKFGEWSNSSVNATVAYDAEGMELSAHFSGGDGTVQSLKYVVDLRDVMPEWVSIGFSASTGVTVEVHRIRSWSFSSNLEVGDQAPGSNTKRPVGSGGTVDVAPAPAPPSSPPVASDGSNKSKVGLLLVALPSGLGFLAAVLGLVWFIRTRRKRRGGTGMGMGTVDDGEINEGTGPKSFTYRQLIRATRNFASDGKVGRGSFGEVYKGFLSELGLEVAVKRVHRDSVQGKKEYLSEINIISRLRHRNLVRLVGWCHDRGELLLVYEYLPNGSLDTQLYGDGGNSPPLTWPVRYKIAQGLASALLYLHEGWEQCVVHRDVKPSNVMLDADFNAKLGDFGLARLVDHGVGMQTTVAMGTWGYLSPECAIGGKASKESDVFSFGVVALEIACGRKAIDRTAEEEKSILVDWVWGMYGQRALLGAADEGLHSDFDKTQMERLMVVGLRCAHPDPNSRPPMRQVVAALNFETSLSLPSEMMPELTHGPLRSESLRQ